MNARVSRRAAGGREEAARILGNSRRSLHYKTSMDYPPESGLYLELRIKPMDALGAKTVSKVGV